MDRLKEWICTDPDNNQYGRKISDTKYEFSEGNDQFIVDLSLYSESEIKDKISSYYKSIDEIEEYYEDPNWIIAECIFEQEIGY